jgi:mono/diheme cytochrome c family protein
MVAGLGALAAAGAQPLARTAIVDDDKGAYSRVCEPCHGPDATGGQGPALVPFKKDLSELTAIVRQGLGQMPAFPRSEISDAEIEQVHSYLKSLTAGRIDVHHMRARISGDVAQPGSDRLNGSARAAAGSGHGASTGNQRRDLRVHPRLRQLP